MKRAAMRVFRRLPRPVRRMIIRAITPSYTVGAVLALQRSDQTLLLVEQRHSPGWALPGGLLRRRESPSDGLIREVEEEVGIRLDVTTLPSPKAVLAPRVRRVDIVYLSGDGDVLAPRRGDDQDEVLGVGWFSLDALPEVSDATVEILRGVQLL
ncbi:MAG: NUDIX hydrolase [Frankiaceae bacterium]|nr:NUDIX hydrolase [Frankiaceae bacterium]